MRSTRSSRRGTISFPWHAGNDGGGFPVGPVEHVLHRKQIAQSGDVACDGAIAEGNKNPRAPANQANAAQMVFVGYGAFDESDIHPFGKLLDVQDRRIAQIGNACEIDQALIQIQKGHVASRAATEPDGGQTRTGRLPAV